LHFFERAVKQIELQILGTVVEDVRVVGRAITVAMAVVIAVAVAVTTVIVVVVVAAAAAAAITAIHTFEAVRETVAAALEVGALVAVAVVLLFDLRCHQSIPTIRTL